MESGQLKRRLGLTSAISITVGAVIGSGIFLKPLAISQALPSEAWIHLMWLGLGLACLFGAFAYAELGSMFPEAGGQYAFLREGWGRWVAFLYGWTFFWVINSGTVAALALGFAKNLLPMFGVDMAAEATDPHLTLWTAVGMILVLAVVNHFGVGIGAVLQNISAFAKVGALGLIIVGGVLVVVSADAVPAAAGPAPVIPLTMAGFVTAFAGIFWAYEGWHQAPFNAAEMKRPERDVPLGLIIGMLVLIGIYVLVNLIYLRIVPLAELRAMPAGTPETIVPRLTIARVFSPELAGYVTLLIAVSIFGAANPNMLSSPRAFYAMAKDGLMPESLASVSPRWGTPTISIWTQTVVSILLVVTLKGFHDVTDFVVFAAFLFYALSVGAVYKLRRERPDAPRPYRCTGYPFTPAIFILVSAVFIVVMLRQPHSQMNAIKGLVIISAGIPFYFWWSRRARGAADG